VQGGRACLEYDLFLCKVGEMPGGDYASYTPEAIAPRRPSEAPSQYSGKNVDSMRIGDQLTWPTGVGISTQSGGVAFKTTHWSVVLEAQSPTAAAQKALDKLCRIYWRPVYGFVRRHGVGPEEAKDLTQGFFALLLERRDLETVRKEKGRLRSYLLTSVKHFLTNERCRAMAVKRGEGQQLIPLEAFHERERTGFEPTDITSADHIYERHWALTVLDQVLARLGDEYRAAGKTALFDQLQKSLTDEPDRPSQVDTAHEFGMTENAVKQACHRLRQRYRLLLREEIAHTVMIPGDIEDELRHLIAVLRA
jgi:RNA polymerase sigma-70 factor (ECF subfamily)